MEISHSSWPWHRSDATALAGYANMMMTMMLSNGGLSVGEHDRPGGRPGAASTWLSAVHLSSNCDSDIVTARKTLMVVRFICPQQLVAVIMARSGGGGRLQ